MIATFEYLLSGGTIEHYVIPVSQLVFRGGGPRFNPEYIRNFTLDGHSLDEFGE